VQQQIKAVPAPPLAKEQSLDTIS